MAFSLKVNYSCFLSDLYQLLTCFNFLMISMQKYLSCKGACLASMGADQPAEVVDDAPKNLVFLEFSYFYTCIFPVNNNRAKVCFISIQKGIIVVREESILGHREFPYFLLLLLQKTVIFLYILIVYPCCSHYSSSMILISFLKHRFCII